MLPVVEIEAGSRPVVAGVVDDGVAAGDGLEVAARLLAEHAYVVNEVVADRIASREQAVCVVLGVHQALRPPEGDNRAVAAETKLVGNDAAYSDRPTNQI